MDLLGGHPMTISIMAPLLQDQDDLTQELRPVYLKILKMMQNKNMVQNLHELNPINSLKITTDASIQHVRQISS